MSALAQAQSGIFAVAIAALERSDRFKAIAPLRTYMELTPAMYFREHDDDEVKGFTVLETSGDRVRLAEKWLVTDNWTTYWVPVSKLQARIEAGHCEEVGSLTDDQFSQVVELTDPRVTA